MNSAEAPCERLSSAHYGGQRQNHNHVCVSMKQHRSLIKKSAEVFLTAGSQPLRLWSGISHFHLDKLWTKALSFLFFYRSAHRLPFRCGQTREPLKNRRRRRRRLEASQSWAAARETSVGCCNRWPWYQKRINGMAFSDDKKKKRTTQRPFAKLGN